MGRAASEMFVRDKRRYSRRLSPFKLTSAFAVYICFANHQDLEAHEPLNWDHPSVR